MELKGGRNLKKIWALSIIVIAIILAYYFAFGLSDTRSHDLSYITKYKWSIKPDSIANFSFYISQNSQIASYFIFNFSNGTGSMGSFQVFILNKSQFEGYMDGSAGGGSIPFNHLYMNFSAGSESINATLTKGPWYLLIINYDHESPLAIRFTGVSQRSP